MSLEIGALAVSCTGSDKGRVLTVIAKTDTHLILADGRKRRLEKPKLKKEKHIKPLNKCLSCEDVKLLTQGKLTNRFLYKSIKESLED